MLDILPDLIEAHGRNYAVCVASDVITVNDTLKDKIKISEGYGKYLLDTDP